MSLDTDIRRDANPTPTRFLLECGAFTPGFGLSLENYNPFDAASYKFLNTGTPKAETNPFDTSFKAPSNAITLPVSTTCPQNQDFQIEDQQKRQQQRQQSQPQRTFDRHPWADVMFEEVPMPLPHMSPGLSSASSSTSSPSPPLDSPSEMSLISPDSSRQFPSFSSNSSSSESPIVSQNQQQSHIQQQEQQQHHQPQTQTLAYSNNHVFVSTLNQQQVPNKIIQINPIENNNIREYDLVPMHQQNHHSQPSLPSSPPHEVNMATIAPRQSFLNVQEADRRHAQTVAGSETRSRGLHNDDYFGNETDEDDGVGAESDVERQQESEFDEWSSDRHMSEYPEGNGSMVADISSLHMRRDRESSTFSSSSVSISRAGSMQLDSENTFVSSPESITSDAASSPSKVATTKTRKNAKTPKVPKGMKKVIKERKSSEDTTTKKTRKRRSSDEENPELKRQKFLERNRMAAAKCREKKRLQTLKTISDADDITVRNQQLHEQLASLQEEVRYLKNQILGHRDCGCDVIQKFLLQGNFEYGSNASTPSPTSPSSSMPVMMMNF
ncbi:hypothetical protein BGZ83_005270 [Gryganskiella cystojenkinii]|nr:hypothetical protein BGZ83_005270 [Gryganskiella cystojenkinii]